MENVISSQVGCHLPGNFTMMSSKKKGGRYTESKKETWRHEKLSTKIQTKSLKKTLQQRLYFRA